jgi:hypothetical protein
LFVLGHDFHVILVWSEDFLGEARILDVWITTLDGLVHAGLDGSNLHGRSSRLQQGCLELLHHFLHNGMLGGQDALLESFGEVIEKLGDGFFDTGGLGNGHLGNFSSEKFFFVCLKLR